MFVYRNFICCCFTKWSDLTFEIFSNEMSSCSLKKSQIILKIHIESHLYSPSFLTCTFCVQCSSKPMLCVVLAVSVLNCNSNMNILAYPCM